MKKLVLFISIVLGMVLMSCEKEEEEFEPEFEWKLKIINSTEEVEEIKYLNNEVEKHDTLYKTLQPGESFELHFHIFEGATRDHYTEFHYWRQNFNGGWYKRRERVYYGGENTLNLN